MMSPPAAIDARGDSAPIDGVMLMGAVEEGAIDSVPIDSADIDAGAMLSGAIDAAFDGAMLAVIDAAALGVVPPPAAVVAAGELLLAPLQAETTKRPATPRAPTWDNLIQGLLRLVAGWRDVCALTHLCAGRPTGGLPIHLANPLRPPNRLPVTLDRVSAALPRGRALLDERGHAFLLVLGREEHEEVA